MGSADGEDAGKEPSGGASDEKIVVLVRLRPLNDKEIARNDVSDWECVNDNTIIFKNNLSIPDRSMYPTAYAFDKVFRPDCSTRLVYEEGSKEVALSVLSGVNASIFAYGQTSSGKTHTMSGITQYAVADIYDHIEKRVERAFVLKFSAMEIYNESVRDLLSLDGNPRRLLDDPERGTVVERLTEETVRDLRHLQELLSVCEAQRQIGETSLNETSSRSHQIIRLTIESSSREFSGNDSSSTLTATVNFVDLAGSERASQTLSAGPRLKEGCHINRSLLTLGTVIRKLSKGRNGHVPFRDSKLTRILQSSLGGNAKSCIICTMSPARSHVEQSRNTLLFGSCAKEVTTNAQVNIVMSDKALVKHLQREISRLESALTSSWPNAINPDSAALLRDREVEVEKLKKEVSELTQQRDHAQSQVQELARRFGKNRPTMTWKGFDQNHQQAQVETPWEDEDLVSETYSLDVGLKESCTTSYSTGYRRCDSDDYLQIPIHNKSGPDDTMPSISTLKSVRGDSCQDQGEIEEPLNENLEDFCKEVQCIEVESSSMTRYGSSDKENAVLALKNVKRNQEPVQPQIEEDKKFSCIHPAFSIPSPQELTPKNLKKDMFSSENMKLTRSRSCNAHLMSSSSFTWLKDVTNKHTPANDVEKDFIGSARHFQLDLPLLNFGPGMDKLSRNGSQTSASSAAGDEQVAQFFTDDNITSNSKSLSELEGMDGFKYEKQQGDCKETVPMFNLGIKNVKDIGLDPIQGDLGSPACWPAEFKRLQREIIKLWHDCNVSLVHRTFFFLIFKGDSADSIYMEVELRRLSFLLDTFSRGNQTVEDGRPLTPASRMRDLSREREMLSNRMQKRLSVQDRESLYLKWGVSLKSKHRRLQLMHRLWTDIENMDHIADSAELIARVVGFTEPGQNLKEMFGLNFTPRRTRRERYSWRRSIMPYL